MIENSALTIQGIVSSSLIDENRNCDISNYAIYTNLLHYIDWIAEKTFTRTEIEVKNQEIYPEIELPCRYDNDDE